MCGLSGYSLLNSASAPVEWSYVALDMLSHRGPDDGGIFESPDKRICLIHTRLAIQDLSPLARQPMHSSDHTVCLVFNGEIYNFVDLREELQAEGFCFVGSSDTEVLLALYLSLKKKSVGRPSPEAIAELLKRLNGIFAIAIWDSEFESILLCRDSFGVKPLYLLNRHDGLYFSSEIKAFPPSSYTLDVDSLQRYLTFLWCPGSGTPVDEISKVGPGEALWITNGEISQHFCWYRLPVFNLSSSCFPPIGKSEAVEGTRALLRQAVHRQLISDVPVGAFLSGGLDSSSIVAFAREIKPDIRCFTIDLNNASSDGIADDLPYACRVASHLNVPLEVIKVDAVDIAAGIESFVWQLDEPLADPAALNVLFISQLARQCGVKVLLSGSGGDDLFTGYRRHFALQSERYWQWLPHEFRLGLRNATSRLPVNNHLFRRIRKAFSGAHLDGDDRLLNYFRWIDRSDLQALFTSEFRASLTSQQAELPMLSFLRELPAEVSNIDKILSIEQRFFLSDHNLIYTDKMSMAVGVEVRVPFLDTDLVDFAARIPPFFKQRGRVGKWVLKKAMEPYLPREVIYRSKSGFGVPLRRWLRVELRDWLADILSYERLHKRGLFNPVAVQRLIAINEVGMADVSYTLFSLACIEIWCSHYIDSSKH